MLTLEELAKGAEIPTSGRLSDLLYSRDGEPPIGNIARYLIESTPDVIAAIRATRQEPMDEVCDDYERLCGQLEAYLQFVDEGFAGYPKMGWPVEQVEFLLASASPMAKILTEAYDASLSQAVIDEIVNSEVKYLALEQVVQRNPNALRVSVKTKNNTWVETPAPYYWMETCGLVGIAYVTGSFFIYISPRGEATYEAAKAQKEAKVANN